MKWAEVDLEAQETKPLKRFMLRWHNWGCDHVSFSKLKYPNCLYGYDLHVEPYEWLVHMYIYFRRNYFAYSWSYHVPFKSKCRKE